jgi:hypothetical protein
MRRLIRPSVPCTLSLLAFAAPAESTAAGASDARIGEPAARATALAAVPNGTIQSVELETERGRKVWSFDVSRPHSAAVLEILVDAKTGRIVSKRTESPREQQREAKADAAKQSR